MTVAKRILRLKPLQIQEQIIMMCAAQRSAIKKNYS